MPAMGRPFQKGQSGNPAGRPKGSRTKVAQAMDLILAGDADAIMRKATSLAKEGDPTALRLCLERLLPPRKDRPVPFALPPIESTSDLTKATAALLEAVAKGELTPSEAAELSKLVADHIKAIELTDIQARLDALEGMKR